MLGLNLILSRKEQNSKSHQINKPKAGYVVQLEIYKATINSVIEKYGTSFGSIFVCLEFMWLLIIFCSLILYFVI